MNVAIPINNGKERQELIDPTPVYHCLKQRREQESGAAALCTIAQHYDLQVTPGNLSRLTASPSVSQQYPRFSTAQANKPRRVPHRFGSALEWVAFLLLALCCGITSRG
jgi:hypothetical protein